MLAGGTDDKEVIEGILAKVDVNSPNFTNYYGKTKSLKDLAVLIGQAEKFVCSDSAPLACWSCNENKNLCNFWTN